MDRVIQKVYLATAVCGLVSAAYCLIRNIARDAAREEYLEQQQYRR